MIKINNLNNMDLVVHLNIMVMMITMNNKLITKTMMMKMQETKQNLMMVHIMEMEDMIQMQKQETNNEKIEIKSYCS